MNLPGICYNHIMAANDQAVPVNVEGQHLLQQIQASHGRLQASLARIQDGLQELGRDLVDFKTRIGDTENANIRL